MSGVTQAKAGVKSLKRRLFIVYSQGHFLEVAYAISECSSLGRLSPHRRLRKTIFIPSDHFPTKKRGKLNKEQV